MFFRFVVSPVCSNSNQGHGNEVGGGQFDSLYALVRSVLGREPSRCNGTETEEINDKNSTKPKHKYTTKQPDKTLYPSFEQSPPTHTHLTENG